MAACFENDYLGALQAANMAPLVSSRQQGMREAPSLPPFRRRTRCGHLWTCSPNYYCVDNCLGGLHTAAKETPGQERQDKCNRGRQGLLPLPFFPLLRSLLAFWWLATSSSDRWSILHVILNFVARPQPLMRPTFRRERQAEHFAKPRSAQVVPKAF
jgi:hypothetical protein